MTIMTMTQYRHIATMALFLLLMVMGVQKVWGMDW